MDTVVVFELSLTATVDVRSTIPGLCLGDILDFNGSEFSLKHDMLAAFLLQSLSGVADDGKYLVPKNYVNNRL